MLLGYTVPQSPLGRAASAPPPPWHYSGDIVGVEFWTDPDAARFFLPRGLKPDPKTSGHAVAMFLDWQFTGEHDELLDPARYQYREFLVLLDAAWGGAPVAYCPFIYVDNDSALARGWIQGFPKKLGCIFQTRTFTAPNAAAAPVQGGSSFGASASAHGQRLVTARVTLREPVPDPTVMFNRPTVNLRYFPRLSAGQHDNPAVNELVMCITDNQRIVDLWFGDADLRFPEVEGEELHALAPLRIGAGFRCSMSYSVTDLRVLENFVIGTAPPPKRGNVL
jgi:acetoacetate decarboxylase